MRRAGAAVHRLERLRRFWPRRRFDECGRVRRDWGAESWLTLVSVVAFIGAAYVDTAVFGAPDLPHAPDPLDSLPPEQMPFSPAQRRQLEALGHVLGRAWQALALLLNAWILDRILTHHTPASFRPRRALVWLRRVLAGVPVVGLAVWPVWQWLARRRPGWAVATPRLDLPPPSPPRPRQEGVGASLAPPRLSGASAPGAWWRGLVASLDALLLAHAGSLPARIAWLLPCQIGPLLGVLSSLHTWPGASGPQRAAALVTGVALHVVAGLASWLRTREKLERLGLPARRAAFVRVCAWAPVLPFPAALLTGLPWLLRLAEPRETRGLVGAACERRARGGIPGTLLAWLLPRERPRSAPVERQRRAFYRLKTAALLWEAGALGFLLAWAGIPVGPAASRSEWALLAWLLLPPLPGLLVSAARTGQGAWTWLASRGRRRGDGQPLGRFLLLAPAAAVSGLMIGGVVPTPDTHSLALVLMLPGVAAYVALTYALVGSLASRARPHPAPTLLLWLAFHGALLGLAWIARQPPEGGAWARALLTAAFASSPATALLLFVLHRRALLAPVRLRSLLDRRWPLRVRVQALAVATCAALPLGGLLVPLLIAWRLWFARRYEAAWLRAQDSAVLATAAVRGRTALRTPSAPATA